MTGDNPMGFWVVSVRNGGTDRQWTEDELRAHRFAELESEEHGAAYVLYHCCALRVTGAYWRIVAIYKKGVQLHIAPGQLWLKLPVGVAA